VHPEGSSAPPFANYKFNIELEPQSSVHDTSRRLSEGTHSFDFFYNAKHGNGKMACRGCGLGTAALLARNPRYFDQCTQEPIAVNILVTFTSVAATVGFVFIQSLVKRLSSISN
jgi:hypothetical protein